MIGWLFALAVIGWGLAIVEHERFLFEKQQRLEDDECHRSTVRELLQRQFANEIRRRTAEPSDAETVIRVPQDGWIAHDHGGRSH